MERRRERRRKEKKKKEKEGRKEFLFSYTTYLRKIGCMGGRNREEKKESPTNRDSYFYLQNYYSCIYSVIILTYILKIIGQLPTTL